jgi:chromosome segregation ATPase
MGRARTTGRINISQGRSVRVPDSIQPILTREGADVPDVSALRQRISTLESQLQDRASRISQLETQLNGAQQTITNLRSQIDSLFTESQVQSVAREAFEVGVQRVIEYLRQRGII